MRGEILAHQEKYNLRKSYMRIGRGKVAKDRLGPCESVVRPSSWHDAYGEAPVEKTYGSSRKQMEHGNFPRWPRWFGRKEDGQERDKR